MRIGFLHTSAVHTDTFERLAAQADATVETVTLVDESLLDDARVHGPASDQVRAGVNAALDRFVERGVSAIVCTCSTIAGSAELEGMNRSIKVMRVDRPMAEAAVAVGRRITVLAALESTVGPTTELIDEVARARNMDLDVVVRLCSGAWECFEAGDIGGYLAIVAAECDVVAAASDVIVLAQASMAGAADICATRVPVISSPRLAVDAVMGKSTGSLTCDSLEHMGETVDDADGLGELIDRLAAEVGLSGVVRVDLDGETTVQRAYGEAHRGLGIANTIGTQFGIASGTKGLTALTVMTLVERGEIGLGTTARSLLGADLSSIDERVTVEHLLAHRSGIGDYLDEEVATDSTDYVMTVPVHELAATEQYLRVLDGHPMKSEPGERFAYNNGGYVVLALLAERATGVAFHDLVEQRVCVPAGMTDTTFLRSDELPGRAALGYLDDVGLRTNVLHLPVRGNGDGGIYTTAADVHALWEALFAGRIVSPDTVELMVRPRSDVPAESMRYGLGFWIEESTDAVSIHGFDAGVGFVSVCDRARRCTYTVLCNTTRGAWPTSQGIGELIARL